MVLFPADKQQVGNLRQPPGLVVGGFRGVRKASGPSHEGCNSHKRCSCRRQAIGVADLSEGEGGQIFFNCSIFQF